LECGGSPPLSKRQQAAALQMATGDRFERPYSDCKEIVVDSFNGRTDCEYLLGLNCRDGGRIVDGDDGRGCWWTDLYGNCLV
jgi:hypothetical protein